MTGERVEPAPGPNPGPAAEGVEVDPATELARIVQGLAAEARRAQWRGGGRVARAETQAPLPTAAPPTHDPPPTRGKTASPSGGSHTDPQILRDPPDPARPRHGQAEPSPEEIHGSSATPVAPDRQSQDTPTLHRERAAACASLGELQDVVAACQGCPLHETRTQTVFQDGAARARVLFIGEAPGADEDAQGVPFVGRAGRLLTDIIQKGMRLPREEVAIANVLKCRPPGNRDPLPAEKAACTPYLDRQIELIDPEVLIPLGRHAAQHLLRTDQSMGRLRGRVHDLGGRKVVPTYHPAYLLRTPSAKKDCWQDIQVAMGLLGLDPRADR